MNLLLAIFALPALADSGASNNGFAAPNAPPARACTELGCQSGLSIRSDLPNDKWLAGRYRFLFTIDGKKTVCQGRLPLPGCDQRSIHCDREGVQIEESGCALPKDAHGFGNVHLSATPASVELEVLRNGKRLGELRVKPEYKTARPNGEGCPPVCRQGSAILKLAH